MPFRETNGKNNRQPEAGNRHEAIGNRRKDEGGGMKNEKTAKIAARNRDSYSQGEGQDPLYVLAEYSITGRRI